MTHRHRLVLGIALATLALAGCTGPCQQIRPLNGPRLTAGTADFTTVAAIGENVTAGYQSGGIVDRHQWRSYGSLFARQTGHFIAESGQGEFTFPAVTADGIPPLLALRSLSPLIISNTGRPQGSPTNIAQAADYHDLAVPGALMVDVPDSTFYSVYPNPVRGSVVNPYFSLFWRNRGLGLQQLIRRQPTFILLEFGTNEVLGSATAGTDARVFPTGSYAAALTGVMNGIHAALPNAKVALLNVPDVTRLPYFRTFPATTLDSLGQPATLIGPGGVPLGSTDLVLITAKDSLAVGTGIPLKGYNYVNPPVRGNGRPLLTSQVLDAAEQTAIAGAVTRMNNACDSVSLRPWVAPVDWNGLLGTLTTSGLRVGNQRYTSAFVTGGLFSLDGVHPNDLAQAALCNTLIDAVNVRFGSTITRLNLSEYVTASSARARPVGDPAGPMQIEGLEQALQLLYPDPH